MNRRIVSGIAAAIAVFILSAGSCSEYEDDRGVGDAPTDQQPDEARKVWPNANNFPNISAFCVGGNGVYTSTREAAPVVVVDDPECGEGGILKN